MEGLESVWSLENKGFGLERILFNIRNLRGGLTPVRGGIRVWAAWGMLMVFQGNFKKQIGVYLGQGTNCEENCLRHQLKIGKEPNHT